MFASRQAKNAYVITEKFNPFMTKGGYQATMSAQTMKTAQGSQIKPQTTNVSQSVSKLWEKAQQQIKSQH